MINIFNLLKDLETKDNSIFVISIWDKLSDKEIIEQELELVTDNRNIYLGLGRNTKEIHINSEFNILFSAKNPNNIFKIKSKILKVNVKRSDNIEFIPSGQNGIALLSFENELPTILNNLKKFNDKFDPNKNEILYLTSEDSMKKISLFIK